MFSSVSCFRKEGCPVRFHVLEYRCPWCPLPTLEKRIRGVPMIYFCMWVCFRCRVVWRICLFVGVKLELRAVKSFSLSWKYEIVPVHWDGNFSAKNNRKWAKTRARHTLGWQDFCTGTMQFCQNLGWEIGIPPPFRTLLHLWTRFFWSRVLSVV